MAYSIDRYSPVSGRLICEDGSTANVGDYYKRIKWADDKPRMSSTDYRDDIAMGNVLNHTVAESFGRVGSIVSGTEAVDLWPGSDVLGNSYTKIAAPITAGTQIEVWSTSASDVGDVVAVVYVEASTLALRRGEATLNGTTHVTVLDLETGNPINACYINGFFVESTADAWTVMVGAVICASKSDNTKVYKIIPAGGNVCECCALMVPGSMVLIITAWFCSTSAGKAVTFYLRSSGHIEPVLGTSEAHSHFLYQDMVELKDSSVYKPRSIGKLIPAGSVVKISAKTGSNGGAVQGGFEGWFEPA